jgi:hypothetical protein
VLSSANWLDSDTEAVRNAIRVLLSEREDITLVGEAATKALAGSIGAARLLDKPDLVHELIPAILELTSTDSTQPSYLPQYLHVLKDAFPESPFHPGALDAELESPASV